MVQYEIDLGDDGKPDKKQDSYTPLSLEEYGDTHQQGKQQEGDPDIQYPQSQFYPAEDEGFQVNFFNCHRIFSLFVYRVEIPSN